LDGLRGMDGRLRKRPQKSKKKYSEEGGYTSKEKN